MKIHGESVRLVRITTVPFSLKFLIRGQLRFLRSHGLDVTMVSADGPEVASVVEYEGCPHYIVPMSRRVSPFSDLLCFIKLIKLFITKRPHIVHTHTPKAGLLGMLAGWLCRVPIRIHTLAGWRAMNETVLRAQMFKAVENHGP